MLDLTLEDGTKETSNHVIALEQKLSKFKEGENIIYETDPRVAEEQDKIKKEHDQPHKKLDQAAAVMGDMEKEIQSLTSRTLMNTAKHLSNNVKISGIPEVEGENPFETVKEFLKTTGGIEAKEGDLIEANRIPGVLTVKIKSRLVELPRQMFVKCPPSLRRLIECRKKTKEQKKDPTDGHYYRI